MSTSVSHHPLAPLGSHRLIWLFVAGLAIAGVTVALVLSLSGSNSPYPVQAVPAAGAGGAGSHAIPYRSGLEHGIPSLNPQARRAAAHHATSTPQHYAPNAGLRKEGLIRRTAP
jgi:hypothetical protein